MKNSIVDHLHSNCMTHPDRCAVIANQARYSYAAVAKRSNKVALGLETKGVHPGERVGVYLEKSIDAIASIYGVLKAGCCYVPISPSNPALRTRYMLNNCGIQFMLTDGKLSPATESAVDGLDVQILQVNDLVSAVPENSVAFTPRQHTASDAAAILHTSGSTGDPKGAVITHGNLSVFVSWAVAAFGLTADDRLLSHAPLQFDLSFFDLFAALAASAAVVLATPADTANAERMQRLIKQSKITIWQSVPSALTLQTVGSRGQSESMSSVRCVLFAGERMPRPTLLALPKIFPNARLYNVYGCTETNDTFMYSVPTQVTDTPDPMPIGQVLPHIQYRIVDRAGNDVDPGKKGQLLVSGETLMARYLGDANKNMMVDGFYPTHDLVSQEQDGQLYFHGRIDSVVKTNGYRVNLTEIEDYLRKSDKFEEVTLFCVTDDLIGNRIIAVLRPKAGIACSTLDLKIYCSRGLPKYAIPHSFYITHEALPRGGTGKVDIHRVSDSWRSASKRSSKHLPSKNIC